MTVLAADALALSGRSGGEAMDAEFSNVYDDERRADAYVELELAGAYYLAYRDLPAILREHVVGTRALDFGCGTRRSTRFLRKRGFDAVGVDIAEHMLARARQHDPEGCYRLVADGEPGQLAASDEDYHEVYRRARLAPIKTYRPLAKESEPYPWVSETAIAPWVIYVLRRGE